jgi:hypothetical protein
MRHHFGDMLHREGGHWTVIPNRERYAYRIRDVPEGSPEVTIVTIGKDDANWRRVFTLPNLEELTLHEPSPEQLATVGVLDSIKRLRITHARPKSIDFISSMASVEELVLEYVSGFSDLAPLQGLKHLRSLHLENLRRVSDFGGLAGASNLRYLAIYGTLDWKQPIDDFEFLRGLPRLETLAFWQMISRAPYPAMLPALSLGNLETLRLPGSHLSTEEYALLEEGLGGVAGAEWGPHEKHTYSWLDLAGDDIRAHLPDEVIRSNHPEVLIRHDGSRSVGDPGSEWFEFTGKSAGRVKCDSTTAPKRCREQEERYASLKVQARALIQSTRGE